MEFNESGAPPGPLEEEHCPKSPLLAAAPPPSEKPELQQLNGNAVHALEISSDHDDASWHGSARPPAATGGVLEAPQAKGPNPGACPSGQRCCGASAARVKPVHGT